MSETYDFKASAPAFTLTSTDIADGAEMPTPHRSGVFGAGGEDQSPQLSWTGFAPETKSFAITAFDFDGQTPSGFWHWMLVNVPASVTSLDPGAGSAGGVLPSGASLIRNDTGQLVYIGSAPPDGVHRYVFAVYALSGTIDVGEHTTPAMAHFLMSDMVLGRGVITALSSGSPQ